MPWVVDKEIKNTMIQRNEKRAVTFGYKLEEGDSIEAVLGYYLVNPKVIEKLNLQEYKPATQLHILKRASFTVG